MSTMADTVFYGGDILTMDGESPKNGSKPSYIAKVEAVAVANGIILAVGSLSDVSRHVGNETKMIYLNRQTLMPGFIECHQHAIGCVSRNTNHTVIGYATCSKYAEVSEAIKRRISTLKPGEWGQFVGWDPELVHGLPILSAAYLDETYTSTNPMIIVGQSFHVVWANSAALKEAGIHEDTPDPPGGTISRDDTGRTPSGKLLGTAVGLVLDRAPKPSSDDLHKGFRDQWRYYASKGFTTVTELLYTPNSRVNTILKELADSPDCPVRLAMYRYINTTDYEKFPGDREADSEGVGSYNDRLWEAGVKLVADGSPHCGTVALQEPFLNTPLTKVLDFPEAPNYGTLRIGTEEIVSTMRHYHKKGTQIAIHCHGERASEQVINAYEQVFEELGNDDRRHRMEHCGLTTVDQLARAAKLNLALSFFTDHLRYYGHIYKTSIFGDRVNRWTPLSEATKLGLTWTLHQDNPAFPGDALPFANMKTAITRCTKDDPDNPFGPEYRVSIHEALKAYTVNAAWQLHREKELGTISPGKRADLVVLSRNPYEVDPFDLEDIEVVETYLQGRSNGLAEIVSVSGTSIDVLQPIGSQVSEI